MISATTMIFIALILLVIAAVGWGLKHRDKTQALLASIEEHFGPKIARAIAAGAPPSVAEPPQPASITSTWTVTPAPVPAAPAMASASPAPAIAAADALTAPLPSVPAAPAPAASASLGPVQFAHEPLLPVGTPGTVLLPVTGHVLSLPQPDKGETLVGYCGRVALQAHGNPNAAFPIGGAAHTLHSYGDGSPQYWPAIVDEYFNRVVYMTAEERAKQPPADTGTGFIAQP